MNITEKIVRVNDGGFVWEFPLAVIADHRAKHYAERDEETTYQEEFDYIMEDRYEGLDWFSNNMDWEDVADRARLVATPPEKTNPDLNSETCSVKVVSP